MSQEKKSTILGLDISKACIGVAIIDFDGTDNIEVRQVTHVTPKIPSKITGIEALILRKEIFEKDYLSKFAKDEITHCIIESPLTFTQTKEKADEIAKLLQFNGLISEAVYKALGIVPQFISSREARLTVFPNLLTIRKFNKLGELYGIEHYRECLKNNRLTLFGEFPFDCDKKQIVLDLVSDMYPEISWPCDAKGLPKKENYDACDALVCAIAYVYKSMKGNIEPFVRDFEVVKKPHGLEIKYNVIADKPYCHKIIL